jgi:Arc/MetJ-type ribon-helix-helix transcriptional regulator
MRSGRYTDESDVMRDWLRALELREDYESPALEVALLEGVRSPRRPYAKARSTGFAMEELFRA